MENVGPRCGRCGEPITANRNVVFPKAGGVEHVDCAKTRKLLARVPVAQSLCLACERPILTSDDVVLLGHDLLHAACHQKLRAIGGASRSSPHQASRHIDDPFAREELGVVCGQACLDAADERARARAARDAATAARARRRCCSPS
jgi:hypothetical protein